MSIQPDDLASTMSAVIQGGYVLARAQGSQKPMDAAIRGVIALLEAAGANTETKRPRSSARKTSHTPKKIGERK